VGNPFTYVARREAFEQALKAARSSYPAASDRLILRMAHSHARNVPVAKVLHVPRPRLNVAAVPPPKLPGRVNRVKDGPNRRVRETLPDPRPVSVLANLSRRHPDYGCTPIEHARRKAERLL